MTASYLGYIIEEFLVESAAESGRFFNMTNCVASIEYFEDLFSPAIFLRLLLVNTSGELTSFSKGSDKKGSKQKYGLRGGERVRLKVKQSATNQYIFLDETKNPYYIYKISGSTSEPTRELLVVDLAPVEVFKNETIRVTGKYKEQTIDASVKQILDGILKTTKTKFIDKTQNSYAFFGNNKKPFTVLTWLGPKSIPEISGSSPQKGTAGFLFFENRRGYYFKSLDNLFSDLISSTTKTFPNYFYSPVPEYASQDQNFRIVNIPTFEKNVNVFENMRIGMYSSVNVFFDLNTKTSESYVYKLTDSYDIMKHSSSKNQKPQIPLDLQNNPSRYMVKLIDSVVADPDASSDPLKKEDNRIKYQSQSIARYNLAFSQMLNITIPLNLSLAVGDIIELNFNLITTDESEQGLQDRIKSGKYLIKELCHSLSKNSGYTGLKLVRDSYGV